MKVKNIDDIKNTRHSLSRLGTPFMLASQSALPFAAFRLRRHRIVAGAAEGIAAEDSADGEKEPREKAACPKRFQSIFRTGWGEAAARGLQRGDKSAVELDQSDAQILHLSISSFPRA